MKENIKTTQYKTPVGTLLLGTLNGQLCLCDWMYRKKRTAIDTRLKKYFKTDYEEATCPVIEETKIQLSQYFAKTRKTFDLPLHLAGSDFQKGVWAALLAIPYGETFTYLELSKKLNNVKAIRAVAAANGANAISIIIPCHRIIGSNGDLIGYAGGLKAKKQLLSLENAVYEAQLSLF